LTAALQAGNLWAVTVSRLGFRAVLQPPLQALTLIYLYRGLRGKGRRPWLNWAWAGLWAGLSAYSYLAIRAFPILLGLFLLWVLAFLPARVRAARPKRPWWRGRLIRLGQIALFGLVAALVFSPLGVFYLRNPEFFGERMGQVSILGPAGEPNRWGPFWHATRVSFGMFVQRGDRNWRFNVPGAPALWWPVGVFFLIGLGIGVWRFARWGTRGYQKASYWLLLLWLPVMLLPSILGGQDVELSLSLRAIGVQPALYIWAALGLAACARALDKLLGRWRLTRVRRAPTLRYASQSRRASALRRATMPAALALLLAATTAHTAYQAFLVWGPSVPGYYVASGDLVHAAEYANTQIPTDAAVYVSSEHYRHPTMALLTERYADLSWLVGDETIVLPPLQRETETWILFTPAAMPAQAWLESVLGPAGTGSPAPPVPLAPDGAPAFRVYRFAPGQAPTPVPEHPARADLGHTLTFLGHDRHGPAFPGEAMDVTFYWRVEQPVGSQDDWTFFAHLVDERGFRWGGETFFHYPSSQWRAGEVILFRKQISIDPGAPPGAYTLALGAFSPSLDARLPALDEAGQLAGTTVHVGPIEVARAPAPPETLPAMQQTLDVRFGKALRLLGSDRDRSDLRPGETLALTLHWLAEATAGTPGTGGATLQLWIEGAAGRVPLWQGDPVQGAYPFVDWQPPEYVRDRYALRLPRELAAGDYALHLALVDSTGKPLPVGSSGFSRSSVDLGTLHIHASDRLWEPPPLEHEVGARLGDAVELVGYSLERPADVVYPQDTLRLTLVWRCLGEIETPYTVFTHLLDEAQQVRGQKDNPPQGGRYPTTLWAPGEIVVDPYQIDVDANAPSGTYVIEVGMYDPATMARLPVRSPTGADADRVLLAQIQVGAR
jgi:hypothetical protein